MKFLSVVCNCKLRKITNVCESKKRRNEKNVQTLPILSHQRNTHRWNTYAFDDVQTTVNSILNTWYYSNIVKFVMFLFSSHLAHTHAHNTVIILIFTGITKTQPNWYELKKVTYTFVWYGCLIRTRNKKRKTKPINTHTCK